MRKLHRHAAGLAIALACAAFTLAGCDHMVDAGCGGGDCHLEVKSGGNLSLGGQSFSVDIQGDHYISVGQHGVQMRLQEGSDITIGKYTLHLNKISGGNASIDVKNS